MNHIKETNPMRTKKGVFGIVAVLMVFVAVLWYSGVIEGNTRTYEIRPEIRLPEHRTDAARAIDAYERLMDRYMSLSEKNSNGINVNLNSVTNKLDSINGTLMCLSERMARIEKALGIEAPKVAVPKTAPRPKEETVSLQSGSAMPNGGEKAKGGGS
jgi:hypothetical protein